MVDLLKCDSSVLQHATSTTHNTTHNSKQKERTHSDNVNDFFSLNPGIGCAMEERWFFPLKEHGGLFILEF